jgi:hypothetical protein
MFNESIPPVWIAESSSELKHRSCGFFRPSLNLASIILNPQLTGPDIPFAVGVAVTHIIAMMPRKY